MQMLRRIQKLSRATGSLRDLVELLERLWCEDARGFEALLTQSSSGWAKNQMIPCALRILATERDDRNLRDVLRGVCESCKIPFAEKQLLFFVAALWGEEWAKRFHRDYLEREVGRAGRSGSGFSSLLWALLCGAMLGQYSDRAELERLESRLAEKGEKKSEYFAMVTALLELDRNGFDGLVTALKQVVQRKKASHFEVKACFVLGAARRNEDAPLFLDIFQKVRRSDWWSVNLRNRALRSLGYCTALGQTTLAAVEEHLVRQRSRMSSWWFGDSWTADLIAMCAVLWNRGGPLSQRVAEALCGIAAGSSKWNAKYASALLTLKNVSLPNGARFSKEDYDLRFTVDSLQYDSILDFSYYWRCKREVVGDAGRDVTG